MYVAIRSPRLQLKRVLGQWLLSVGFELRNVFHQAYFSVKVDGGVPLTRWFEAVGKDEYGNEIRIYFGPDISVADQRADEWAAKAQGRTIEVHEAPMIEPMKFISRTDGDATILGQGNDNTHRVLLAYGAEGFENAPTVVMHPGVLVLASAIGVVGGKFAIEVIVILEDGKTLEIADHMASQKVVVRANLSSPELVEVVQALPAR